MEGKVLKYKLAWVDESNTSVLHSKMYETKEEALLDSQSKKDFMLFSLDKMDDGSYTWDLLPYGNYNSFIAGMSAKSFLVKWKYPILLGIGLIMIYKIID